MGLWNWLYKNILKLVNIKLTCFILYFAVFFIGFVSALFFMITSLFYNVFFIIGFIPSVLISLHGYYEFVYGDNV